MCLNEALLYISENLIYIFEKRKRKVVGGWGMICNHSTKQRLKETPRDPVFLVEISSSNSILCVASELVKKLYIVTSLISESTTRFLEKEKEWYSAVDDTGWCALVFRCLQLSRRVIRKLMDNQRSVIVIGWCMHFFDKFAYIFGIYSDFRNFGIFCQNYDLVHLFFSLWAGWVR